MLILKQIITILANKFKEFMLHKKDFNKYQKNYKK